MLCLNESDYQRQRVYDWEAVHIPPGRWIPFEAIESYIADLYKRIGWKYPPIVKPMPKQVRKWAGDATHTVIRFPEYGANERTIIHEVAHAMTSTVHDTGDAHGPAFVGTYIRLAAPTQAALFYLWSTAQKQGVDFSPILEVPKQRG